MTGCTERVVKSIGPLDESAMRAVRERQYWLTKPRGSLGRLEELSVQIAGITGRPLPVLDRKVVVVMAADHGVVVEGVSLYPQAVTRQMVLNFLRGGAGINVLARLAGARVVVVDMGVVGGFPPTTGLVCRMIDFGTKNMARGPAMTRDQAVSSIEAGIEVVEGEIARGMDIVATGDMGIGNTTASAAICAVFSGEPVSAVAGRGTGLDDVQLRHKVEVIERALQVNRPDRHDPLDVLAKVGGFEIGGLAGGILGAASRRIPVVIDGFVSGAAAMVAVGLCPRVKEYLIAGHVSAEAGHAVMLRYLGLRPLLDLGMRLGEGTGAALAMLLAEAAVKTLSEMATFGEAGVSDVEKA
ncbi:MAG: nicotinate-nucleotide--dimethylbenzimidazole phosphoribosyltransferase [Dehalococcoidia bacterium]|nr:nicotinate-nucleotide--dimethylbenzimidazole phosphoribosyltransferase [Dehalococcoidia bacterium]